MGAIRQRHRRRLGQGPQARNRLNVGLPGPSVQREGAVHVTGEPGHECGVGQRRLARWALDRRGEMALQVAAVAVACGDTREEQVTRGAGARRRLPHGVEAADDASALLDEAEALVDRLAELILR
ncbi:MAG: hypothetical protein ACR2KP_00240 [Egibacteraceae bacterium]